MKVKNIADGLDTLKSLRSNKNELEGLLKFIDEKYANSQKKKEDVVDREFVLQSCGSAGFPLSQSLTFTNYPLTISDAAFLLIYQDLRGILVSNINRLNVEIESLTIE